MVGRVATRGEKPWKQHGSLRGSSYRQTLSMDPIASRSLNLETSATRVARDLLVLVISKLIDRDWHVSS